MKCTKSKLSLFPVCAILYSSSLLAGIFGPSSYDECMIEEMKGQDITMYRHAHKHCLKEFEEKISYKQGELEYKWRRGKYDLLYFTITKNLTGHHITKVLIETSDKDCSISKDSDYTTSSVLNISGDSGLYGGLKSKSFNCSKLIEAYGYKE